MAVSSSSKAFQFATKAHAGQKRTSGEPFITHLTAVADLLKDIGADEETITAAYLHDILEDTSITARQLQKEFGPIVANLVEGVTKVQRLEKTFDKRMRNMESIRKMFRTMGRDIRVLFIKLADRLHNMRTIQFVSVQKQIRIARETQDIYCPLAQLLGVRVWYEELADHCFRVLDPVEAEFTERKFAQIRKQQHRRLDQWMARMQTFLRERGVKGATVELQRRHGREVRTLSVEQEESLQHLESFYTVLTTLKSSADCYEALGVVHAFSSPLPGTIEDYIASPKVNGYEALKTTVLTSSGTPMTIIVQTKEMKRQARLGMATLYGQPAKQWRTSVPDWLEALLTLDESEQDLQAFFHRVRLEIFAERNRVQFIAGRTKKAIDIPAHASVLDLAYYADKDLGSRAVSAMINGQPASLKELIHDGDTIEVTIDGKKHPRNAQDLYCIHTALAHKHLVSHLSTFPRRERIAEGRALLQNALRFTMDPFFSIRWQKDIRKQINGSTDVVEKIGCGMIDAFLFAEERAHPEDFFLLDPNCFEFPSGLRPGMAMRYVLRATLEELRQGNIVGLQVGPDVIDVVATPGIKRPRWKIFSREIVPLKIRHDHVEFPYLFALKWSFAQDTNPLKDIAALESFLDTPVHLLQFAPASVTLGFRTDRLRTLQVAYKYLYGLPHITELFRITPG